jgi:hypothetical protein
MVANHQFYICLQIDMDDVRVNRTFLKNNIVDSQNLDFQWVSSPAADIANLKDLTAIVWLKIHDFFGVRMGVPETQ